MSGSDKVSIGAVCTAEKLDEPRLCTHRGKRTVFDIAIFSCDIANSRRLYEVDVAIGKDAGKQAKAFDQTGLSERPGSAYQRWQAQQVEERTVPSTPPLGHHLSDRASP